MMSAEVSDDTCPAEESSICDRTFELLDATFPSLTPVIDRKGGNCDRDLASPLLDANRRTGGLIDCEVNFEQLSLAGLEASPSFQRATPLRERRKVSTLPKSMPMPSVAAAKGESAFYRRKAYDEARRKNSLSVARVDPRRRASITAMAVAGRERVGAAALRASKRAEARRQAMDKNRPGLHS